MNYNRLAVAANKQKSAITGALDDLPADVVALGKKSILDGLGLALSGGRVFVPTTDLHVIALDARTGAAATAAIATPCWPVPRAT